MSGNEGAPHRAPSSLSGRGARRGHRCAIALTVMFGLAGGSAPSALAITAVESQGRSALDGQTGVPSVGDTPRLGSGRRGGSAHRSTDAQAGAATWIQGSRQFSADRGDGRLPLTARAAVLVLLAGAALSGVAFLLRRA